MVIHDIQEAVGETPGEKEHREDADAEPFLQLGELGGGDCFASLDVEAGREGLGGGPGLGGEGCECHRG